MKGSFVIYGAGGHGRVIADLVALLKGDLKCFFDDSFSETVNGFPVMPYQDIYEEAKIILALGRNDIRAQVASTVFHRFGTLIHPTASVSPFAEIGEGTVILAHAVVQANARIGKHVIINAGVVVDHDAVIGDFVHLSPNSYIGGGAVVENGSLIEPCRTILRNSYIDNSEFAY